MPFVNRWAERRIRLKAYSFVPMGMKLNFIKKIKKNNRKYNRQKNWLYAYGY